MLSDEEKRKVDVIVENYRGEKGALISLLQDIQDTFGYLPQEVLSYLSEKLKVPESRIWGIVTFYTQFYLYPKGKYT
ncbi:NAD(P)H-dependent oxidoreductase subunit E, partial [Candidatus Aerophobetes bacterium]|nr:NAD(P)H-dependent oxidoreductase subunit E [Candidatus Aerophobetes bacterium]